MREGKHRTVHLPFYRSISVINLHDVISDVEKKTQLDIFNYYDTLNIDLSKSYCKRFYYHHFIKEVCETYIDKQEYFTLVFHYKEKKEEYNSKENEKIIKLINKYLPIIIFNGKVNFSQIRESNKSGELEEECIRIKNLTDKKLKKDYSFRDITTISKRYKLNFLSESYFTDLNIKYNLIR